MDNQEAIDVIKSNMPDTNARYSMLTEALNLAIKSLQTSKSPQQKILTKKDITQELCFEPNKTMYNTHTSDIIHHGKKIGTIFHDTKEFDIDLHRGFSLKVINSDTFPPTFRVLEGTHDGTRM